MDKKICTAMVLQSYTRGDLDEEKIMAIASMLNRRQLKEYSKALKIEENKRTVEVAMPGIPSDEDKKDISRLFPDKKIAYTIDPSLLAGMRVRDSDDVYEYSLNGRLVAITNHIAEDL